jgi:restriction endonuclease S subunit
MASQTSALKDIVGVLRSGFPFRGAVEPHPQGNINVLQIKDVSADGDLDLTQLVRIKLDNVGSHLVERGDVLFVSRGQFLRAAPVRQDVHDTIASYQLLVLRPGKDILPEYLAWYLNQAPARAYFDEHATGSHVPIVSARTLGDLPVAVPPPTTQQAIIHVHQLAQREAELIETIKTKRQQLVKHALLNAARRGAHATHS